MNIKSPSYILKRCLIPVIIMIIFAAIVVALNNTTKVQIVSREGQTFEKGIVTEIIQDNLQPDGTRAGQQLVVVHMTSGAFEGEDIAMTSNSGYLFGAPCTVGMKVVVMQSVAGDTQISSVYSQDREWAVYIFAALYLLALCLIGGWQGVKGALGLIFTFGCIIFVYLPLVYRGWSPFWTAVIICAITAVVSLYLIGGPTRKTLISTIGTVAGVVIAGSAASIFSLATGVTGWNVSDIESLITLWNINGIQVGGLLFSGLLISALGAAMDVAISITSSISELYFQQPDISRGELFKSGMRIGRDMMGTNANTLILAFAGGSVSMLVMDYAYDLPWLQIINSNNICISIMQGLSGSFGIVLSVPVTVALAVFMYTNHKKAAQTAESIPAEEAPSIGQDA